MTREPGTGATDVHKLAPELQHALEVWRVRSPASKELAERRITVSVVYRGDVKELERAGLTLGHDENGEVSGQIAFVDVERLAAVPGVVSVTMQPNVRITLDESVPETRVPWKVPPGFSGKGTGVIIAVIDTGIDIFHESFRKPGNKTRILELWDQSATVGGSAPPAGFAQIGRVYNAAQIEAALAAGPDATPAFGSVDSNGHGTHVAGIAAGNGSQDDRCSFPGRYVGVAPEADLVIVKAIALPAGSSSDTRDALRWCAQAGSRHGNKPVVINCSFGSDLGAHDGNDYHDVSVDRILRPTGNPVPAGLAVVASAGNEGDGDTHESGTLQAAGQPGATKTISFYMPANSSDADPIAIWYDAAGTFTVQVTAPVSTAFPGTNTTGPFAPGGAGSPFTIGGMQVSITSSTTAHPSHPTKKDIFISISTTAGRRMRDGVWTLTLTNTAAAAASFDIWTASSHTDGYPVFRLPDEGGPAPASRRNNTIGSPGMCRNAITVANYYENEIWSSSSRGPAAHAPGTPSGEVKPTVAAVGAHVTAARSRLDSAPSSCCDQKVTDKNGTSMSAPHVAGVVALMFEKNRELTFEQARGHLQHSARIDGIPAGELPILIDPLPGISWNNIWGAGKVNAQVALAEIPEAPGGGGGGGGGTVTLEEAELGYTPHTIYSRLGDWHRRVGPRPGLMLVASLVSEHVDEILRLINRNNKVGAVWRKNGGPLLVRHLLYGIEPQVTILPAKVPGCDVRALIPRFLPILTRFASARLKADIERFGAFAASWPGAPVQLLDEQALRLTVKA